MPQPTVVTKPLPALAFAGLTLAALALALPLTTAGLARASEPPAATPDAVLDWLRSNQAPVGLPDSPVAADEAALLERVAGDARVLAFGESTHYKREPLDYRNRLIRHLVTTGRINVLAFESGIAQGRRIDAFIAGGPGKAEDVVQANITWTFGRLAANLELVRWLREYNASHPQARVRFYGIDVSGGDDAVPFVDAKLALSDMLDHLARAAPRRSQSIRSELTTWVARFTPAGYAAADPAARDRLERALADAERVLAEPTGKHATDERDWAAREALDCRRLVEIFKLWPPGDPRESDEALRAIFLVSDIRDGTMADHLQWVLGREGRRARVLLFAANGHVAAAPLVADGWRQMPITFTALGQHLRRRLGDDYRAIATVPRDDTATEGRKNELGTMNRALAAVGAPPRLVLLRGAPREGWWSTPQSFSQPGDTRRTPPVAAYDALLYLPPYSPAPTFP